MADLFGLLGRKPSVEQEIKAQVLEEEQAREMMIDTQVEGARRAQSQSFAEEQATPRDQLEYQHGLVEPSKVLSDHPYHSRLTKEFNLSFIEKDEVRVMEKYQRLIDLFLHDGLNELADVFHAEMMGRLNFFRSVDGFQQRVFRTQVTHATKEIQASIAPKQQ